MRGSTSTLIVNNSEHKGVQKAQISELIHLGLRKLTSVLLDKNKKIIYSTKLFTSNHLKQIIFYGLS